MYYQVTQDIILHVYLQSSVNSTISILSSTPFTASTKDDHALVESLVSVRYVHGGLNLLGFFTADELTPLAVADTPDSLLSLLLANSSPLHSTNVLAGVVLVRHSFLPADVAAWLVASMYVMRKLDDELDVISFK